MTTIRRIGRALALAVALAATLPGCTHGRFFDLNDNHRTEWYEVGTGIVTIVGLVWLLAEADWGDGPDDCWDECYDPCR